MLVDGNDRIYIYLGCDTYSLKYDKWMDTGDPMHVIKFEFASNEFMQITVRK